MKLPLIFLFLYLSGVPAPPIGDHVCGYTHTDTFIGEDASEINEKPLEIFIDGLCEGILVVQEVEEENLTSDSYDVSVFYSVEGSEEELIDEEKLSEIFLDSVDTDDNGIHVSLKCSVINDDLADEEEEGSQTRTSPSMMMTLFSLLPLFYFVNDKSTKKVLLLSCLIALIPLSASQWRDAILQQVPPQGDQPCGHFEVVVKLPTDVFFSSVDLDDGIEFYCEHPLCSTLDDEEGGEEGGAEDGNNVEEVEGGFLEEEGYFVEEEGYFVEEEGFLVEEGGDFVEEEGEYFFFEEEGDDFVEEGDILEEEVEFVVEEILLEEEFVLEEEGAWVDWVPSVPDVNPEGDVLRNLHVGPFVGVSAAVVTVGLVFIFMRKKRKNYYAINTAVDVPHQ